MSEKVYTVSFSIEVDATSPEAAAELAHFLLSTRDTFDGAFKVQAADERAPHIIRVVAGKAEGF